MVVVSSADMPRMSGLCFFQRGQKFLDGVVDAEIDDFEPRALEHHRDQVLADVVDVALDGADHDLADGLHAGFRQQRAAGSPSRLHGVGSQQHLRHEQDAVAEIDADDAHAFDQGVVQHPLGDSSRA